MKARLLGLGLVSGLLAGCALLTPLPKPATLEQRLAQFPTRAPGLAAPVSIRWNDHHVPFIEAESDDDAAFALGLVHAHLRLGQMEMLRRIAAGRIAEMGGPLALDIDRGLRILNFARAAAEIERDMPATSRHWIERFVAGVNHYQAEVRPLPHEFAVLGLNVEPWTTRDVLTIGRLVGSDVNWLVWASVLALRQRPDWPALWTRLVSNGVASLPSFEGDGDLALLDELFGGLSRSGSNSLAIAPSHTDSGAAIMANDPHLGILLPNTWLIVGLVSPSYHVVGLTAPGLPLFAIGRNPQIAWGGTNMRAASSELWEVTDDTAITTREEDIAVRWWPDRNIEVRETPHGPVISDAPIFDDVAVPDLALKWTGHQASDEIGAMLAVARAKDFREFRAAFDSFAVPGQNMLYADEAGNVGQVMAVRLPQRDGEQPPDVILAAAERDGAWQTMRGAGDLPFSLNPERGYLVSANNRPAETGLGIGYFFSPDDRIQRMGALLSDGPVGIDDIKALQQDVHMPSSVALRDVWLAKLDEAGLGEQPGVAAMRAWDGQYTIDSKGAVAFEQFRDGFTASFYALTFGDTDWQAFANVSRIKTLMLEDIRHAPAAQLRGSLEAGLARIAENGDIADWGDMHRLRLSHPLANLPLIGGRYRFSDIGVGGSTDTIMKTAHSTTAERHSVRYGSNARHVSDMSDMDENYFVLLGGQDGWINSSSFVDQLALWQEGRYLRIPLRRESLPEAFPHQITTAP